MLLCYITNREQFPGKPTERRRALLENIAAAARAGVDVIQLREKDLTAHDLEQLAREAVAALARPTTSHQRPTTRLFINSRADVALATGADGVHLPAGDLSAAEVRALWVRSRDEKPETRSLLLGVSCHTPTDVATAAAQGADLAVFGPVFEKAGGHGVGLEPLREACVAAGKMPVLALGGVTLANAVECLRAGAAGVAGIRLFQDAPNLGGLVAALRRLDPEDPGTAAALGREGLRAHPSKLTYRRRLPHLQEPGHPLFVTFKAFPDLSLDEACRTSVLEHCLHDHGAKLQVHAVVVMPNHVHLLFTPLEDVLGHPFGLAEIMNGIKGASAHSVNSILGRSGPVWREESFDHRIRSEHDFEEKLHYIEWNPVEAHLARTPGDYRWLWKER